MGSKKQSSGRISVKVKPSYSSEQSQPENDRYVFSYDVKIKNSSDKTVKLMYRHWVITDTNGRKREIQGEGVVGGQPSLEPGEEFEYTSWTILETPNGHMQGHYHMEYEGGKKFETAIPAFSLTTPTTLH